jgi:excisionase family DNA binding protein
MAELPLYMTAPEAAQVLRVKPDRLRGWIERGELPAANLGDKTRPRYRIARSDLLLFLERRSAARPPPILTPRRRKTSEQGQQWRRY